MDVKQKIKKLLAMAEGGSENEQIVALKQAKRLMLKHNLTDSDINDSEQEVIKIGLDDIKYNLYLDWKNQIHQILCENFRCLPLFKSYSSKHEVPVFLGLKTDVEVCVELFKYLINRGIDESNRVYRYQRNINQDAFKRYYNGILDTLEVVKSEKYVKNSFLQGYVNGIEEGLDTSLSESEKQEYALALLVPEIVMKQRDLYEDGTIKTKNSFGTFDIDYESYVEGIEEGRKAARREKYESIDFSHSC